MLVILTVNHWSLDVWHNCICCYNDRDEVCFYFQIGSSYLYCIFSKIMWGFMFCLSCRMSSLLFHCFGRSPLTSSPSVVILFLLSAGKV